MMMMKHESKHEHNNSNRVARPPYLRKREALASGNLSEDDPVKMRAKKLKSDDGDDDDDEGEEDGDG